MSPSPAIHQSGTLRLVLWLVLGMTVLCSAQTEATRDVFLPSGKVMRVLSVSRVKVGSQGTALVLTYQTDLSISNHSALRKEIDEVWSVFKGDVDTARLSTAIITAKETPQGVVLKSGGAHYFMFRKVDGEWRMVSDTERSADQTR